MNIRLITDNDCRQVADMISRAVRLSPFSRYYPQITIDEVIHSLNEDGVRKRASWTHFYVIEENDIIIGCGAIGPYYNSETESSLFSIFVDPIFQGKGYGKKIIEILEQDEYFLRANRVEIPASIVAIPFYRRMGYDFKNGELVYSDGHFALEKFR